MCSYLASFPAALAHAFIARYTRPGDVVLDPFSGRGTTPLQACAEGRIGAGNDLNPFAHLLTAAKVEPAGRAEALTRVAVLRLGWSAERDAWDRLAASVIDKASDTSSHVPAARRPPTSRFLRRSRWRSTPERSDNSSTSGRASGSTIGSTASFWPP
jgi:hypothetical protein